MTLELVTIPNVPLMTAGIEYPLSTGKTTFTMEDLADAVAAQDDPAVKRPRLKVGHGEEGINDIPDGGEPAFGQIDNLRLDDAGTTLYGDYVNVPKWLAEAMPSSFPSRSIDGMWDVQTTTGKKWKFVITAVSLLGVSWPGISNLDDLEEVLTEGIQVAAVSTPAKALVNVEDVQRTFYTEFTEGDRYWWWIQAILVDPMELIVRDDDTGDVYRIPYTASGDDVTFGEPVEVRVRYEDVKKKAAASIAAQAVIESRGDKVAASYNDRAESRVAAGKGDVVDPKKIREALGLAEDATDEQVKEALKANNLVASETPAAPAEPTETPAAPAEPTQPETPAAPTTEPTEPQRGATTGDPASPEPTQVAATVSVDKDTWEKTRQQAAAGAQAAARQAGEDRDRFLDEAVKAGKFAPARRDAWKKSWDADPEGTKATIESLEGGLIPIEARGGQAQELGAAAGEGAYPDNWFPEVAARKAAAEKSDNRWTPGTVLMERG